MLLTQVLLVVPAGIAGTQRPWKADYIHLPVFWIPAIPAGMTAVSTVLGLEPVPTLIQN